ALHGNYPNPFNPTTTLTYDLPEGANLTLAVYDVSGREVARLVEGYQVAGSHRVVLDGANLTSGIYFAVFKTGSFTQVQKLVLMK
ncbi:MAG: T9SS C-terminal target domain-containing protein, partial [Candidatus Zixiibacteriota bacterium]